MSQYTPEQFLRICKRLPEEIKEVLFAEETGDLIYDICQKYDILKNLGKIVDLVREVLIGSLDPDDLQEPLKKELKVEAETAKRITQEIDHFIFGPIKDSLDVLYKKKPAAPAQSTFVRPSTESSLSDEELKRPRVVKGTTKKDVYREPVGGPEEEK